jgi:PAS domain S-box-containing protein
MQWCRTFGHLFKDINDLDIYQLLDNDWKWVDKYEHIIKRVKSGEKKVKSELNFRSKDGRTLHMQCAISARFINNKLVSTNWLMRDITELKNNKLSIDDISDQYISMFESTPTPLLLEDTKSVVLQINKAACDLIGYEYKQLIGKKDKLIVHEHDYLRYISNKKRLAKGEINNFTLNINLLHKDGFYENVQLISVLIRNSKLQPRLIISELIKTEDPL